MSLTILDAAYASIANLDRFSPFVHGVGHTRLELVSAVREYANPTAELLREARKAFGASTYVAIILSIGCGNVQMDTEEGKGTASEARDSNRFHLRSGQVHRDVDMRLRATGIYFRFDVEQNYGQDSIITSAISAYLDTGETSRRLDKAASRLYQPLGSITLEEISKEPTVDWNTN